MPVGPYSDFGTCVGAQKRKGYSDESARKICGAIEQNAASTKQEPQIVEKFTNQKGKLFVRAFLIDPSLNLNKWAVTEESIAKNINTFIGKPLVLTENFDHPGAELETLNHWLAYQETFRVGTIIDIVPRKNPSVGSTAYFAIIEITNEDLKHSIQNNEVPVYVSPAIAEPFHEGTASLDHAAHAISEWTGIHLAIVSEPAYGIKRAVISETCGGDRAGCLLQLRKAHINHHGIGHCGFCVKQAMQKYRTLQSVSQKLLNDAISNNTHAYTSLSQKSSAKTQNIMSQLESMDSSGTSAPVPQVQQQEQQPVEKVEQSPAIVNKQPISPPTRVTTLSDAIQENQRLQHELQLSHLKIQELTDANNTIVERIGALELQSRREKIERIITPDVIRDDKARLEKIKYFVGTAIPLNEIEELYKDIKVTLKKASIGSHTGGKVPYYSGSTIGNSVYGSRPQESNAQTVDEEGLTRLQKQLAVLEGGI